MEQERILLLSAQPPGSNTNTFSNISVLIGGLINSILRTILPISMGSGFSMIKCLSSINGNAISVGDHVFLVVVSQGKPEASLLGIAPSFINLNKEIHSSFGDVKKKRQVSQVM